MTFLKEQNYFSLVIQLTSSKQDVRLFLTEIDAFLERHFDYFEYIFVSNNAPLSKTKEVSAFFKNKPGRPVHLLSLAAPTSSEQAVLAGIEASIGDFVMECEDTLFDYPVDLLFEAYQACLTGKDIVLVKPKHSSGFFSKVFYRLLNRSFDKKIDLTHTRFHLFSRRAINRINNLHEIIHYRKWAYCNSGLQYAYLEYTPTAQFKGYSPKHSIDFATDLLLLFTDIGKKATLFFTFLFAGLSICSLLYTITVYFIKNTVPGWATIMLLMSLGFMGLFFCFTMVIKYLNLILKMVLKEYTLPALFKEKL